MKRKLVLLAFASLGLAATAQTAAEAGYGKKAIAECQRLHSDGEYKSALILIEKIDPRGLDERTRQEYDLQRALTTFENDHHKGKALMMQYLAEYPNSSQKELLNAYIAQSHYFDGDFEVACALFADCDFNRLAKDERQRASLYYALSLLETGNESNAVDMLQRLKVESKRYATDAAFHLAVIDYEHNRLNEAHSGFKSIQMSDSYYLDIPYYLAAIELKRGNDEAARGIAERFIADHGDKPQGVKMRQILGAVEFNEGNYGKAIKALDLYTSNTPKPQRIAMYQLALSLYNNGEFDRAKELLDNCTTLDDEISQNALLHKGMIALEQNDANGARLAFELASQMTHSDKVREEALYNYAMCLHKANHSAFGEGVRTFEKFLNEYPNSKHASTIGEQLVDVYMNTKSYNVALESINKINNPSAKILKAKQNILYRLGVQEFINGNNRMAIDYMNRSLELAKYDKEIHADALFWKGEALYKVGEIASADKQYRQSAALGGSNRNKAIYGIAYVLFQNKDYSSARTEFERFVRNSKGEDSNVIADAYSRIGDCYYYQRQFNTAKQYYDKATSIDSKNADYSLFRSAITLGMSKDYEGKAQALRELIAEYPNSTYSEQAYYELGRTYIEQGKQKEGVAMYDKLVQRFPQSQLARRAATEKAMVYNSRGDNNNAIKAYKNIIEQYPHSEEAQIALQDLKNIYIEMGNVSEYADYVSSTSGLQKINSNELDTLAYTAAERFYSKRDLAKAEAKFQDYLNEFPQGAFRLNSHYYLGLIQHNNKEYDAALKNLKAVTEYPNNKFNEEALVLTGEILYGKKEFASSIAAFKEVLATTIQDERRTAAHMNIMRAARQIKDHDETIGSASQLIGKNGIEPEWEREAMFSRAKAHIALGDIDSAMDDLEPLAEDTRTKEGAESKYLLAELMFNDGQLEECEEEIMEYIETSTPHTYWLARSFVLLSDVYITQGKNMEARQYLISLQNNYNEDDDIVGMIEERLSKLDKTN